MSTDYTKKKNAELEELLKARSLPHTGKKAELVARLQQYDADQATTAAPAADDEIDWEDDALPATTPAGAAAISAGGLTQPPNPTAVPNQAIATDPSKTADLTVEAPAPTTTATTTEPPLDFTAGAPSTTLDAELAKRAARAARFGITESNEDAIKALERAKKFGTVTEEGKSVRGLDEALPERRERRSGRGGRDGRDAGRRGDGRSGGRERGGTPKDGVRKVGGGGMSERDRIAAETRRKRFAGAA